MTITIPFELENTSDCLIELRDIAEGNLVAEIFRGRCDAGYHEFEFDPASVPGGLEAGIYTLYVVINGAAQSYPIQYMP